MLVIIIKVIITTFNHHSEGDDQSSDRKAVKITLLVKLVKTSKEE